MNLYCIHLTGTAVPPGQVRQPPRHGIVQASSRILPWKVDFLMPCSGSTSTVAGKHHAAQDAFITPLPATQSLLGAVHAATEGCPVVMCRANATLAAGRHGAATSLV
ncbi:hypothetical protein BDY17DRAFT_293371 [Neohortaea acidophila]|uniref:Uncharacterized protein n=1 Tax=Neohortaea acidophila TaxID=245834 RepID=A0A6A6PZ83_9PEZI|nr:uncharacterized protein BDY17DRAFT_293371 [Neohortaea acidophila]KAF2485325.1 hypothetical protein BDY17DRAFT_293371 [Neohortaea acidophila]